VNYIGTNGYVVFNPGETTQTIPITVLGDSLSAFNTEFDMYFYGIQNAQYSYQAVYATIVTTNSPISSDSVNINVTQPPIGNTNTATFTVTLSRASDQGLSVYCYTSDGTAHSGTHYLSVSTNLQFNPGETSKQVTIPILPGNSTAYTSFQMYYYDAATQDYKNATCTIQPNISASVVHSPMTLSLQRGSSKQVQLTISSAPTGNCVIESSSNLIDWQPLCTKKIIAGQTPTLVLPATNGTVFYRATVKK
jgi:hypothetical protein